MTITLPKPRTERLFGSNPVTEADLKARASFKRRDVQCPECGGMLTLIKVSNRKNDFETTTYQCHNQRALKMCLTVVSVTDSVPYFMRPGDFDDGDVGWKQAAPQTIPVEKVSELIKAKAVTPRAKFDGVKIKPEYPGSSATLNKIIWEFFWTAIIHKGSCDKAKLEAHVLKTKGDTPKARSVLKDLPKWITYRTGYAIKLAGGEYTITGRTQGGKGQAGEPYSTEAYRKAHGFPI